MTLLLKKEKLVLVLSSACLLLCSCSKQSPGTVDAVNEQHEVHSEKYVKPGANVVIRTVSPIRLPAYSAEKIVLSIATGLKAGVLKAELIKAEGLNPEVTSWVYEIGKGDLSITIPVTTEEDGYYSIALSFETEHEGERLLRVSGVDVIVGNPPEQVKKTNTPEGGIQIMDAEEKVH
ncbi:hypothetical protein [Teredinibacter sp. KSP-S5-2]|uniref:hypothetical protein n=1 Tax=Teredinibacter sp. KSP-S5-2 TaxID=3034506 RepID=UPI002934C552|nr:hypothetical protein [Teredinibacter sp. KSP-S5-2]WNO09104.1 hypothetical protein P5V12_19355 [Teredinibacter sp. KSP-S5-2]